jgi:hypothetical protein
LTSEPVVETRDGQQDVFVDLLLLPTQEAGTARVGVLYAGNGFGFYTPLHKDDEVLVCAPSGNPDEGLVVTQRLWSPADPPPAALATYPTDVLLVVEPDKSLRLNVSGGGKVYIGANDGTQPVALGQSVQDYLQQVQYLFNTLLAWVPVAGDGGAALKTALTTQFTPPPVLPDVRATLAEVK